MTYTVDRLNCIIDHYYIYQQTDRVRESVITCLGDQSMCVVSSSVISAVLNYIMVIIILVIIIIRHHYRLREQIFRSKEQQNYDSNNNKIEWGSSTNIRSNGYSMRNTKIKIIQLIYKHIVFLYGGKRGWPTTFLEINCKCAYLFTGQWRKNTDKRSPRGSSFLNSSRARGYLHYDYIATPYIILILLWWWLWGRLEMFQVLVGGSVVVVLPNTTFILMRYLAERISMNQVIYKSAAANKLY